ncbi:hypothetical protein [Streptomyces kanamyceticus]|uniref:hypothetical protein n=1 Tax=Streptomyces kanamyceticus TaxID=1967 RepID=UPI0037DD91F7
MTERRGETEARERARLLAELRALGRSMDGPGPGGETMAERVIAQIIAERIPPPAPEPAGPAGRLRRLRRALGRGLRARWRAVTAALCGALTVLAFTPPVRAAVFEWFDFGGVEVRYDPSASPSAGRGVPGCGDPVTLAQARSRAGFTPAVPGALGTPDAVSVTRERGGRVLVSLCWREGGGTIRLDEFPALLDPGFGKTVREPPDFVEVGRDQGLWFGRAHRLTFWMRDEGGGRWTRSERTAGPTLLWTRGQALTLRLEGVASRDRALDIAESVPTGPPGSGT